MAISIFLILKQPFSRRCDKYFIRRGWREEIYKEYLIQNGRAIPALPFLCLFVGVDAIEEEFAKAAICTPFSGRHKSFDNQILYLTYIAETIKPVLIRLAFVFVGGLWYYVPDSAACRYWLQLHFSVWSLRLDRPFHRKWYWCNADSLATNLEMIRKN
jgi:hypothetical protein